MDEISRGIATAALTLQSVLLQTLVQKGALTQGDAIEIVDKSLNVVTTGPIHEEAGQVASVAIRCLKGLREGLVEAVRRH